MKATQRERVFVAAVPPAPVADPRGDPDVDLDLAAVFATAFERGRYARSIDYAAPLAIALAQADRAWAEARERRRSR